MTVNLESVAVGCAVKRAVAAGALASTSVGGRRRPAEVRAG